MNLDIGLMTFDLQAVPGNRGGRSRADFTFRASTMVVLGDTEEELSRNARAVKKQIAFYASTRTYQAVLAVHGLEDLVPRLHPKSLPSLDDPRWPAVLAGFQGA